MTTLNRVSLVVTVALEVLDDSGNRLGRFDGVSRKDVTDNIAIARREPLARHIIRETAACDAGDVTDGLIKRLYPEAASA